MPFLYRYPILGIVEDCSKHMLMNEIELLNWFDVLVPLFSQWEYPDTLKHSHIRVTFYHAARITKKIYNSAHLEAIDTYLSNFQF